MAALDGVDVLFVGPTDLSHSLGVPGQFQHPTFLTAIDTVAAACRAHGKAAGILLKGAEDVSAYLYRGYTFIGLGSDGGWILERGSGRAGDGARLPALAQGHGICKGPTSGRHSYCTATPAGIELAGVRSMAQVAGPRASGPSIRNTPIRSWCSQNSGKVLLSGAWFFFPSSSATTRSAPSGVNH